MYPDHPPIRTNPADRIAPPFARNHYFLACYLRAILSLFVVVSLSAVATILLARQSLEWSLNHVHYRIPLSAVYELFATRFLVDPSRPFLEQWVGYVVSVGTWRPLVLVVVGAGVLTLVVEWRG